MATQTGTAAKKTMLEPYRTPSTYRPIDTLGLLSPAFKSLLHPPFNPTGNFVRILHSTRCVTNLNLKQVGIVSHQPACRRSGNILWHRR